MARPIENTERISAYITPEMRESLEQIAKDNGMRLSGFIRFVLNREIENPTDVFEGMTFSEPTEDGFLGLFVEGK